LLNFANTSANCQVKHVLNFLDNRPLLIRAWDTFTPIEDVMPKLNVAVEREVPYNGLSDCPRHICDSRKVPGTCMVSR
jgi:hypothetical protein